MLAGRKWRLKLVSGTSAGPVRKETGSELVALPHRELTSHAQHMAQLALDPGKPHVSYELLVSQGQVPLLCRNACFICRCWGIVVT